MKIAIDNTNAQTQMNRTQGRSDVTNTSNAHTKSKKPERLYSGQAPTERRTQRRQKLISAGFELFGSVGFNQTKVDQVCALAGVGIRSIYAEFENLEGLFKAVYDQVTSQAYTAVEDAMAPQANSAASERLTLCIQTYLLQMLEDPRRGRIVSIESSRLDQLLGTYRNQALNKFADLIATIPTSLEDDFDGNVRVWSLLLAGGMNEAVIDCVLAKDAPDIEALSFEISKLYLRTLNA
jgi:AcrR family transcriptional regulator